MGLPRRLEQLFQHEKPLREHDMKRAIFTTALIASVAVATVNAKPKSVDGEWTFSVEHIGLKLVLAQKNTTITGTLDWPHGDPIKLAGRIASDTLTFSGDSRGENFTIHIDSTGSLKSDGTLAGTLKAHFVDFNDAHEAVRPHDQEIPWTAERGVHGIAKFGR